MPPAKIVELVSAHFAPSRKSRRGGDHATRWCSPRLRPVEAVQTWLAAAEINSGPVFRAALKGGRMQEAALSDRAVVTIVKQRAAAIGLSPEAFAGHSLRAGYVTRGGSPTHRSDPRAPSGSTLAAATR
jgi:hypothetical protein